MASPNIYRHQFYDITPEASVPIPSTSTISLQPVIYTYPTNKIDMTIPTDAGNVEEGWREAAITNPGLYNIYIDGVKDANYSPIWIGSGLLPLRFAYLDKTITGTFESKQTITVGSGDFVSPDRGGSFPTVVASDACISIVVCPKADRTIFWDNLGVASNIVTFDIWASSIGQDDTALADIFIDYWE